jgi:hypothetical protein
MSLTRPKKIEAIAWLPSSAGIILAEYQGDEEKDPAAAQRPNDEQEEPLLPQLTTLTIIVRTSI